MKSKKIVLSLLLGLAISGVGAQSTLANNITLTNIDNNVTTTSEAKIALPSFNTFNGKVLKNGNGNLLLDTIEQGQVLLNVTDKVVIIDGVTGLPTPFSNIKSDAQVTAISDVIMTLSLPPMTNAKALIVNVDETKVKPMYVVAKHVEKNNDGTITVTTDNDSVKITLTKDTAISPYLTRNIVRIEDVTEGSKLLVWKKVDADRIMTGSLPPKDGIVICSLPPKIEAEKCILLPNDRV